MRPFRLISATFLFLCVPVCEAADLQEIIRRATAVIQTDWAADADYSYVQREEFQKKRATGQQDSARRDPGWLRIRNASRL